MKMRKGLLLSLGTFMFLLLFVAHKKGTPKSPYDKLHYIMQRIYGFIKGAQKDINKDRWNFLEEFEEVYTHIKRDLKHLKPAKVFAAERKIFTAGYNRLRKDFKIMKKLGYNKDRGTLKRLLNLRLNLGGSSCAYCHSQLKPEVVKKIWQTQK